MNQPSPAALPVSIGTLRRVVDELVHGNVLARRQGKGTFVAKSDRLRGRKTPGALHAATTCALNSALCSRRMVYRQLEKMTPAAVQSFQAQAGRLRGNLERL